MLFAICDVIRCDAEVTAESPVLGDCFNGKMFLSLSKFYLTELELFKWTVNAKTKACLVARSRAPITIVKIRAREKNLFSRATKIKFLSGNIWNFES